MYYRDIETKPDALAAHIAAQKALAARRLAELQAKKARS